MNDQVQAKENEEAEGATATDLSFDMTETVEEHVCPLMDKLFELCERLRLPMIVNVLAAENGQTGTVRGRLNMTDDIVDRVHPDLVVLANDVHEGDNTLSCMSAMVNKIMEGKTVNNGEVEIFNISEDEEKQVSELVDEIDRTCYEWNLPFYANVAVENSHEEGYIAIRRAYLPEHSSDRFSFAGRLCIEGTERACVRAIGDLGNLLGMIAADRNLGPSALLQSALGGGISTEIMDISGSDEE